MIMQKKEVTKRISEVGKSEPITPEKQSQVEREVLEKLMGTGRPIGYGVGVSRYQVTQFSFDLRKTRSGYSTNENRFLLDKVDSQSKQIESQSKQIESQSKLIELQSKQIETQSKQIESQNNQMKIMDQRINECTGELQLFRTAFQGFYTTPRVSHHDISGTRV